MISDAEKHRYLQKLVAAAKEQDRQREASMLQAIADDYQETPQTIASMRPWFEAQIALGKTVADLVEEAEVPRHRIIFALTQLGLVAPGMRT